jgi:hypothetical protein
MFSDPGINGKRVALHPVFGAARTILRRGKEEPS